jgi:hypothetical protein
MECVVNLNAERAGLVVLEHEINRILIRQWVDRFRDKGTADSQRGADSLICAIQRPGRCAVRPHGQVCYQLKTPYRDGTTHVVFEPLDFVARLAALVPKPRVNLTRFHGVFAPNSALRARITPAQRGKGSKARLSDEQDPTPRHRSMTWAQRLKRVFHIDIETCSACGGAVKIIACIEGPAVIQKILDHLDAKVALADIQKWPERRAPPQAVLLS